MKRLRFCSALAFAAALITPALAASGDTQFLLARDAFRAGDPQRLDRAAAALGEHELQPWIEYYRLRMRLDQADDTTVQSFLKSFEGSYAAEKLRTEWLQLLAKKERWSEVEAEAARLKGPEQDMQCLALQARLARKDPAALDEIQRLWLTLLDPPETCRPVLEALIWEKRVLSADVWERIRRQFEANRTAWARVTMAYLPASQTPEEKQAAMVIDKPAAYLARLPANWANTRLGREMAALAVQRLAASEPAAASEVLERLGIRMNDGERQWAWGQIGLQLARRHQPEALDAYRKAGKAALGDEAAQWKARAALRALDWATVHAAIESMPPALATRPEWIYWLGRAYKAGGRLTDATELFGRIAGQPNFYGNLADEELARRITTPSRAAPVTGDELARAEGHAGLKRSLAFFRLDMRTEAVREWNYSLRGMGDRELLAAAELARRHHIYDRAINTADRTQSEHDFQLRYLAPFGEQVRPAARNQSLDDAWVYGLMRQESRFITNARSSVGASGLMQLMPATAKWVAKKIGLKDYQHSRVNDTETNLLLGTSYMRMVLESLDNHPVLASAAYNAGPGRARKWQAERPLEGAIYAETIPFSETRDYVKKVMSNAVYYSLLFNGGQESLKARLGTVAPRGATRTEELP